MESLQQYISEVLSQISELETGMTKEETILLITECYERKYEIEEAVSLFEHAEMIYQNEN